MYPQNWAPIGAVTASAGVTNAATTVVGPNHSSFVVNPQFTYQQQWFGTALTTSVQSGPTMSVNIAPPVESPAKENPPLPEEAPPVAPEEPPPLPDDNQRPPPPPIDDEAGNMIVHSNEEYKKLTSLQQQAQTWQQQLWQPTQQSPYYNMYSGHSPQQVYQFQTAQYGYTPQMYQQSVGAYNHASFPQPLAQAYQQAAAAGYTPAPNYQLPPAVTQQAGIYPPQPVPPVAIFPPSTSGQITYQQRHAVPTGIFPPSINAQPTNPYKQRQVAPGGLFPRIPSGNFPHAIPSGYQPAVMPGQLTTTLATQLPPSPVPQQTVNTNYQIPPPAFQQPQYPSQLPQSSQLLHSQTVQSFLSKSTPDQNYEQSPKSDAASVSRSQSITPIPPTDTEAFKSLLKDVLKFQQPKPAKFVKSKPPTGVLPVSSSAIGTPTRSLTVVPATNPSTMPSPARITLTIKQSTYVSPITTSSRTVSPAPVSSTTEHFSRSETRPASVGTDMTSHPTSVPSGPEYDAIISEEKAFEKQYKDWKKQYHDWKVQNKDHPDKKLFAQYETQWRTYEHQMEARCKDIQERKEKIVGPQNRIAPVGGPGPDTYNESWNRQDSDKTSRTGGVQASAFSGNDIKSGPENRAQEESGIEGQSLRSHEEGDLSEQGFESITLHKNTRFTGPETRFTGQDSGLNIPGSRFSGPGSGYPVQDSRFPGPRSRFSGPDSRFTGPEYRFPGKDFRFPGTGPRFTGQDSRFHGPETRFHGHDPRFTGPENRFPGQDSRGSDNNSGPRFDAPGSVMNKTGPRMGMFGERIPERQDFPLTSVSGPRMIGSNVRPGDQRFEVPGSQIGFKHSQNMDVDGRLNQGQEGIMNKTSRMDFDRYDSGTGHANQMGMRMSAPQGSRFVQDNQGSRIRPGPLSSGQGPRFSGLGMSSKDHKNDCEDEMDQDGRKMKLDEQSVRGAIGRDEFTSDNDNPFKDNNKEDYYGLSYNDENIDYSEDYLDFANDASLQTSNSSRGSGESVDRGGIVGNRGRGEFPESVDRAHMSNQRGGFGEFSGSSFGGTNDSIRGKFPERGRRGGVSIFANRGALMSSHGRGISTDAVGRGGIHDVNMGRGGKMDNRGRGGFDESLGRGRMLNEQHSFNENLGHGGTLVNRGRGRFSTTVGCENTFDDPANARFYENSDSAGTMDTQGYDEESLGQGHKFDEHDTFTEISGLGGKMNIRGRGGFFESQKSIFSTNIGRGGNVNIRGRGRLIDPLGQGSRFGEDPDSYDGNLSRGRTFDDKNYNEFPESLDQSQDTEMLDDTGFSQPVGFVNMGNTSQSGLVANRGRGESFEGRDGHWEASGRGRGGRGGQGAGRGRGETFNTRGSGIFAERKESFAHQGDSFSGRGDVAGRGRGVYTHEAMRSAAPLSLMDVVIDQKVQEKLQQNVELQVKTDKPIGRREIIPSLMDVKTNKPDNMKEILPLMQTNDDSTKKEIPSLMDKPIIKPASLDEFLSSKLSANTSSLSSSSSPINSSASSVTPQISISQDFLKSILENVKKKGTNPSSPSPTDSVKEKRQICKSSTVDAAKDTSNLSDSGNKSETNRDEKLGEKSANKNVNVDISNEFVNSQKPSIKKITFDDFAGDVGDKGNLLTGWKRSQIDYLSAAAEPANKAPITEGEFPFDFGGPQEFHEEILPASEFIDDYPDLPFDQETYVAPCDQKDTEKTDDCSWDVQSQGEGQARGAALHSDREAHGEVDGRRDSFLDDSDLRDGYAQGYGWSERLPHPDLGYPSPRGSGGGKQSVRVYEDYDYSDVMSKRQKLLARVTGAAEADESFEVEQFDYGHQSTDNAKDTKTDRSQVEVDVEEAQVIDYSHGGQAGDLDDSMDIRPSRAIYGSAESHVSLEGKRSVEAKDRRVVYESRGKGEEGGYEEGTDVTPQPTKEEMMIDQRLKMLDVLLRTRNVIEKKDLGGASKRERSKSRESDKKDQDYRSIERDTRSTTAHEDVRFVALREPHGGHGSDRMSGYGNQRDPYASQSYGESQAYAARGFPSRDYSDGHGFSDPRGFVSRGDPAGRKHDHNEPTMYGDWKGYESYGRGFGDVRRGDHDQTRGHDPMGKVDPAPAPPNKDAEKKKSGRNVNVDDIILKPARFKRPKKILIVLRGAPGTGKTYLAKLIREREVENGGSAPRMLCLDDYFMVEIEKKETDPETGKIVTVKRMEHEYEPGMEEAYRESLFKAFKKTIDNGFFSFIIYDAVNDKIKHVLELFEYCRRNHFFVYVAVLTADVTVCAARNTHKRSREDIQKIVDKWEPTPSWMWKLDCRSILQDAAIPDTFSTFQDFYPEVEMEDEMEDGTKESSQNEAEMVQDNGDGKAWVTVSKWEMETSGDKMDKLDGLRSGKRKRTPSPQNLEEYLQLDLSEDNEKRGKKKVRWMDIEERKRQVKQREIGFVVGQTAHDWNRMTDDSFAEKALNRTKYI